MVVPIDPCETCGGDPQFCRDSCRERQFLLQVWPKTMDCKSDYEGIHAAFNRYYAINLGLIVYAGISGFGSVKFECFNSEAASRFVKSIPAEFISTSKIRRIAR